MRSAIRLPHDDHTCTLRAGAVALMHDGKVLVGYRFRCKRCRCDVDVSGDARVLALLHAFGVETPAIFTASSSRIPASDHLETISLRAFLDDQGSLAAWMSDVTKPAARVD